LTQIDALSWSHNKPGQIISITRLNGLHAHGLVIHFSAPVMFATIDEHVFQVLVRTNIFTDTDARLACRCPLVGTVIPVDAQPPANPNTQAITTAKEITPPSGTTNAVAFLID
jgi:hypothetical protein